MVHIPFRQAETAATPPDAASPFNDGDGGDPRNGPTVRTLRVGERVGGRDRVRLHGGAPAASVVSNLVLPGVFKYYNFGVDSYNALMADPGWGHLHYDTVLRVILPLGIGFYTFQSLSYVIDGYRGDAKAIRNFVDFSRFVSMVPHLVAGPIQKVSFEGASSAEFNRDRMVEQPVVRIQPRLQPLPCRERLRDRFLPSPAPSGT